MKTLKTAKILPYMAEIFEVIDFEELKKTTKANDKEAAGFKLVLQVAKKMDVISTPLFKSLAIYTEKEVEEIEEQELKETIDQLKELFAEAGVADFFNQAV